MWAKIKIPHESEMKNDIALSIHRGQCNNVLKSSEAFLSGGSSRREMFLQTPPFLEQTITNYTITLLHKIVQTLCKLS